MLKISVTLLILAGSFASCKERGYNESSELQANPGAKPKTHIIKTTKDTFLKDLPNGRGKGCQFIRANTALTVDMITAQYASSYVKVHIVDSDKVLVPCDKAAQAKELFAAINAANSNERLEKELEPSMPQPKGEVELKANPAAAIPLPFDENSLDEQQEVTDVPPPSERQTPSNELASIASKAPWQGFIYVGHLEGGREKMIKLATGYDPVFGKKIGQAALSLHGNKFQSGKMCFRGVSKSLEKAGIISYNDPLWASMSGAGHAFMFAEWANANPVALERRFGLKRADTLGVTIASAPVGSVIVYPRGGCFSPTSGHIEIVAHHPGYGCSDFCWEMIKSCKTSGIYIPVGKK